MSIDVQKLKGATSGIAGAGDIDTIEELKQLVQKAMGGDKGSMDILAKILEALGMGEDQMKEELGMGGEDGCGEDGCGDGHTKSSSDDKPQTGPGE